MFTRLMRACCPWGIVEGGARTAPRRSRSLLAAVLAALGVGAAAPAVGEAKRTPTLRAHGAMLEWTRAGRRNEYRLLIRVRRRHGRGRRSVITVVGRSFRPRVVPGATVVYRVKAAFNESGWSNRTWIAYPGEIEQERPTEARSAARREEPPEEGASGEGQGQVRYRLDAASYFDSFATPQFAPWVRSHIALIKGYPPFADDFRSLFGLPLIGYHDPATEGQAPLGPGEVATYVGEVRRDVQAGYSGVFIDDANWSAGFNPSPGPPANLANLIEAIRAAEPSALIEINSQYRDIWPLMRAGDPDVSRALRDVNLLCVEFGVGSTSGIDSGQEYGEFMQYADSLHAKGVDLTLTGDRFNNNVATMEYNLATYFLLNNGHDYVSGTDQTPENWWSGFDANLGNAVTQRTRLASGLWTRRFRHGVVYTLEPGAPPQTIALGKAMHSAEWGDVQSLTLAGGQGAVLAG
jgi:hypothetical protein